MVGQLKEPSFHGAAPLDGHGWRRARRKADDMLHKVNQLLSILVRVFKCHIYELRDLTNIRSEVLAILSRRLADKHS